jgi:DNA (cytosine-5)-methyltransferase 1
MGGSSTDCGDASEPWADWNGGLAHHLRVDDGLSSWVAQSRIAVGGPKGTVAASLIVEAFGDAVCPQIPEAIGRAIIRVERALAAITQNEKPAAANNNDNDGVRDEKAT